MFYKRNDKNEKEDRQIVRWMIDRYWEGKKEGGERERDFPRTGMQMNGREKLMVL